MHSNETKSTDETNAGRAERSLWMLVDAGGPGSTAGPGSTPGPGPRRARVHAGPGSHPTSIQTKIQVQTPKKQVQTSKISIFTEMIISNVNVVFFEFSNVHTNTFHAANRVIRPCRTKNLSFTWFWGVRDFAVFYYPLIPIDPYRSL